MESLCNCPELQSVTLHNCGLLSVEGLEKCTEIQELYLEVSGFFKAIKEVRVITRVFKWSV